MSELWLDRLGLENHQDDDASDNSTAPTRRYVDERGNPVNQRGQLICGAEGMDSEAYVAFFNGVQATYADLRRAWPTPEQFDFRRGQLATLIDKMPDAGEREDAGVLLAQLSETAAHPPQRRSPEYERAREVLLRASDPIGDPEHRIAKATDGMTQLAELADSAPSEDAHAIRADISILLKISEALRMDQSR